MSSPPLHPWNLDPEEAARIQNLLSQRLVLRWDEHQVETIGGVDVSFRADGAQAAIVVLQYPDLTPIVTTTAVKACSFPYIPGLLSFREGPAILAAWDLLPLKPDLVLFDGQGIAHPRRLGLAAQMGLWLDLPTIGVAKSRLYGRHAEVGIQPGEWTTLWDERAPRCAIGAVLRTRPNARPVYVSPGHKMDLRHAVAFTLACCRGYRLPEPLRLAHLASRSNLPSQR